METNQTKGKYSQNNIFYYNEFTNPNPINKKGPYNKDTKNLYFHFN